jgi:hypothetical protein
MENSFQNYPERLGYCFHSNGFEKNDAFWHACQKSTEVFYRGKITIEKHWRVVITTNNGCKMTTENTFNEMITF